MRLVGSIHSLDRRKQEARLDALRSRIVKARAGFRCERCGGSGQLQDCHVFSRAFKSIRWDLENAIAACTGCHQWGHRNPLAWYELAEKVRGPEVLTRLRMRMGKRVDLEVIKLGLLTAAKLYGVAV